MAESYNIHLTDPLASVFKVRAFTSNGTKFPTSPTLNDTAVASDTSLLVYGKGHPNYGERIAENMIHIMENFAGSTEPLNAIPGQLWYVRNVIYRESGGSYYLYDDDTTSWTLLGVTAGSLLDPVVDGSYITVAGDLYLGVDDATNPLATTWLQREFGITTNAGSPSFTPEHILKVYTGTEWKDVRALHSSTFEPVTAVTGDLWYDASVPQLKVYNGSAFISVADRYLLLDGTSVMTGDLNMNAGSPLTNKIINLAEPIADSDGATKGYVDVEIAGVVAGSANDLPDLGDVDALTVPTVKHYLRADGVEWINSALLVSDLDGTTVTAAQLDFLNSVTSNVQTQLDDRLVSNNGGSTLTFIAGTLTFAGGTPVLDMGGGNITNAFVPAVPGSDLEIANKKYVDDSVGIGSDTFIASAILHTTTIGGSPILYTKGDLVLAYNDATPELIVSGIALSGHTHPIVDGQYTPTEDTLLSDLTVPPTNAEEAFEVLDGIVQRRTLNRRFVQTASASQVSFNVNEYDIGSHQLFVFVNGIKYIANTIGQQFIEFSTNPINTSSTGLASATTYTATVTVDSAGSPVGPVEALSVLGSNAVTFKDLINEINSQLTGSVATLEDGEIIIYSDSSGTWSTISIADTDLFSSLTGYVSIGSADPGVDYGYAESTAAGSPNIKGGVGTVSGVITFTTPMIGGETIETVVIGDSNRGLI